MQAKVPKFIDVEDKIVGPFTWKQFAYLGLGGSFGFIVLSQFKPYIGLPIGGGILGLSVAFAFIKVNGRPFGAYLSSLMRYNFNPRRYFWQKETPRLPHEKIRKSKSPSERAAPRTYDPEKLLRIAQQLDAHNPKKRERGAVPLQKNGATRVRDFQGSDQYSKKGLLFPKLDDAE